ncbi:hypothetical protein ACBY01_06370 [Sphingomonas sp. ac-8]|uniref:hypothetical protein n=1 Tax=Sphingomonas sp. ac-8 TaxID=3242977 RepID=UPI003A80B2A7
MRSTKMFLATVAALGLSAMPVVAQAAPAAAASKLSVAKSVRADTASKGSNLAGVGILPAVLAAAIVIGGIVIAVDGDDDDTPDSN